MSLGEFGEMCGELSDEFQNIIQYYRNESFMSF